MAQEKERKKERKGKDLLTFRVFFFSVKISFSFFIYLYLFIYLFFMCSRNWWDRPIGWPQPEVVERIDCFGRYFLERKENGAYDISPFTWAIDTFHIYLHFSTHTFYTFPEVDPNGLSSLHLRRYSFSYLVRFERVTICWTHTLSSRWSIGRQHFLFDSISQCVSGSMMPIKRGET